MEFVEPNKQQENNETGWQETRSHYVLFFKQKMKTKLQFLHTEKEPNKMQQSCKKENGNTYAGKKVNIDRIFVCVLKCNFHVLLNNFQIYYTIVRNIGFDFFLRLFSTTTITIKKHCTVRNDGKVRKQH